ncbi:hypothetical protein F4780DRAFT_417709 [Xylariomycetidae sp. FL0641]|nr:hypothetical protein F4780DRAFT_417709 [Xylariomycetidae sp. FL0641]
MSGYYGNRGGQWGQGQGRSQPTGSYENFDYTDDTTTSATSGSESGTSSQANFVAPAAGGYSYAAVPSYGYHSSANLQNPSPYAASYMSSAPSSGYQQHQGQQHQGQQYQSSANLRNPNTHGQSYISPAPWAPQNPSQSSNPPPSEFRTSSMTSTSSGLSQYAVSYDSSSSAGFEAGGHATYSAPAQGEMLPPLRPQPPVDNRDAPAMTAEYENEHWDCKQHTPTVGRMSGTYYCPSCKTDQLRTSFQKNLGRGVVGRMNWPTCLGCRTDPYRCRRPDHSICEQRPNCWRTLPRTAEYWNIDEPLTNCLDCRKAKNEMKRYHRKKREGEGTGKHPKGSGRSQGGVQKTTRGHDKKSTGRA